MVEIVEEPDDGSQPGASSSRPQPANMPTIVQYVSSHTIDSVMFAARLLTVFFAINYMLPIFAIFDPFAAYYKLFAASAATFALRLHTRTQGRISFTREFLSTLVMEDAFHYLIYSVQFLMAPPVSMAILPVTLYAALHSSSYLVKLLKETGHHSPLVDHLERFQLAQTQNVLGIIACAEIFLVPLLVSLILSGRGSLMLPFVYYRFLTLRYSSRRNPHSRQAFAQMRMSLEQIAYANSCPQFARGLIQKAISFISSLAPPTVA
ncbi:unnamed protein product [Caenorhabditis bovis]|uniref:Transmembrane protein 33 homolog n=1 Tax=Caenorhabditis bovis TaxID=2654633 RepID=A0A8S1ENJ8_9PELO|nr:unnamed protein product [Caenorhabditis bovis]